jgi:hypothetical protein
MKSTCAAPLLVAFAAAVVAASAGCGNVNASSHSQVAARTAATSQTCDRFQMCGDIGAGKTYETRASCETQVGSFWDQTWPPAECESKIDPTRLDVCLAAIRAADCANPSAVLVSFVVNCSKAQICDLATDGGGG